MNKEQQELLDEAYENYTKTLVGSITFSEREKNFKSNGIEFNSGYPNYTHYTQEEFINKCKTEDALSLKWREEYRNLQYGSKEEIEHLSKHYTPDTEFSERWGLKIEEQTILEQVDQNNPVLKGSTALYPRKLITITYNDKTIESYE